MRKSHKAYPPEFKEHLVELGDGGVNQRSWRRSSSPRLAGRQPPQIDDHYRP